MAEENTLDMLMSMDPLELSDEHLDEIVKFLRQQRMMVQYGVTPKKAKKAESPDLTNVMSALMVTPQKQETDRRD